MTIGEPPDPMAGHRQTPWYHEDLWFLNTKKGSPKTMPVIMNNHNMIKFQLDEEKSSTLIVFFPQDMMLPDKKLHQL